MLLLLLSFLHPPQTLLGLGGLKVTSPEVCMGQIRPRPGGLEAWSLVCVCGVCMQGVVTVRPVNMLCLLLGPSGLPSAVTSRLSSGERFYPNVSDLNSTDCAG